MTGAALDAARAWRRNELDKLRSAVVRASPEMKRLDAEAFDAIATDADAAPPAAG